VGLLASKIPERLPALGNTMSNLPASILEGREAVGPWNYAARTPEGASSRAYAFAPLLTAILVYGMGLFLTDDVSPSTPFLSNGVVWIGLINACGCLLVWAWMFWGRWVWTAPQMGIFGITALFAFLYAFQLGPVTSMVVYGNAPIGARVLVLIAFFLWHGWWVRYTWRYCAKLWDDVATRDRIWIRYDCATVYRRSAAKAALDALGFKWHPGPITIVSSGLLVVPMLLFRRELVAYFDIAIQPMVVLVGGMAAFTLFTTALTAGIALYFYYPAILVKETDKPVLVDQMTAANAPIDR
jgi:hypothetical protein